MEKKIKNRRGKRMSSREAAKFIKDMEEYARGLNDILKDKEARLEELVSKRGAQKEMRGLKAEIQELETQISGLREFSEDAKLTKKGIFVREIKE